MTQKSPRANFFWPLAICACVAMALLIGGVFALVRQFDLASTKREQIVVANGIQERVREVAQMVVPQVVWDDAVRNLDNHFSAPWARDNVAQFLSQTDGFDFEFVLDAQDRPLFAADKNALVDLSRYGPFAADSHALLASVRAAEARRGPLVKPQRKGQMLAAPIQANAIAQIGEHLYILTATLVQPDFGAAMPKGLCSPIVVTAMQLDPAFLDGFSRRFMLDNLDLRLGDLHAKAGAAHAPLRNYRGDQIAVLEWSPQEPGRKLLRGLVTPILFVVGFLGIAVLLLFQRGARMAQGLIASEARATHLAYYDPLTGLPNRALYFDRLGHALEQTRRNQQTIAVHCIDLDRFKEVNDTYGHQVGDELIQAAARRMAELCRASDTFTRLSGDEFAILQIGATSASASALATRLVEMMTQPFQLGAGRVFIGCSVGVSLVSGAAVDAADALRQADLALYRAKQNGKGQYCFFELEMDAAIKTRRALEADLRDALARNELELAYQPQVNYRGVMIGVEALARWRHPQRGDVSPTFFVPVAEECGLIGELGMYTLRRAFEDSRRWGNLKIAVNVSATQLRMKDFVTRIADLVSELDVDPRQFELELTEGVLLGDDPFTHDTLRRLRNLGFALALDDFGTGYSSLSYLQRYPINKIKIDRSFISNLGVDGESDAVVSAIVKLARALKLSVIAEGVETMDQRERLSAAGCGEVQGFLFSKPISAADVDRLCADRTTPLSAQMVEDVS